MGWTSRRGEQHPVSGSHAAPDLVLTGYRAGRGGL